MVGTGKRFASTHEKVKESVDVLITKKKRGETR